jgi:hypothetical protein
VKREFSEESKEELYQIIDDINDRQWCGFTDWMGDLGWELNGWIETLELEEYTINN